MRSNPIKQKLRSGQPSFGTWLSLGDLYAARLMARMGFDWLTLDMEHQPIDWSTAGALFGAIADGGCVPLCRVPEGNHHYIKRALDAGAWGIVAPMVDTIEQARAIIAATKYPPLGNRSLGGGLHALNFDATPTEYYRRANDEILVVLQTESPRGVANAEEIYRLPGVDAIFVGPNDLQSQMRTIEAPVVTSGQLEAAIQHVIAVGKKAGTPTGMHVMDPAVALRRAAEGMQFIAVGSELRMMSEQARRVLGELHPGKEQAETARY